jgi:hypothetical protein
MPRPAADIARSVKRKVSLDAPGARYHLVIGFIESCNE